MEERRLEGGRLLKEKRLAKAAITRELGVSRAAVSQWAQRMRSGGLKRLHRRPSTGRRSKLSRREERRLVRILKRGALVAGFETDRWTLKRIQQVIRHEFEVDYHPNYINRLMRRLNWSWQQPLPQAIERDEEAIATWRENDWPRLKKARRTGAEIVFIDEFGFSFQEPLGRTWAPCGQRPVVKRVTTKRRVLSTAVALTLSGKIYKQHVPGSFNALAVIAVLKHLERYLPNRIWDRASIHRDRRVKAYLAAHPEISVEWLPAYAPELNPS